MAAVLQRLPWLLFGLYAGVVADRLNRRAIAMVTGLVRAAILLLLTASILTHHVNIAVVLAALFLFGVNETFGDTTTTTLLPMLVGPADLGIANSRALTGRDRVESAGRAADWVPRCSRPGWRFRSSARAYACSRACC